jgi:hypothetical protein
MWTRIASVYYFVLTVCEELWGLLARRVKIWTRSRPG